MILVGLILCFVCFISIERFNYLKIRYLIKLVTPKITMLFVIEYKMTILLNIENNISVDFGTVFNSKILEKSLRTPQVNFF